MVGLLCVDVISAIGMFGNTPDTQKYLGREKGGYDGNVRLEAGRTRDRKMDLVKTARDVITNTNSYPYEITDIPSARKCGRSTIKQRTILSIYTA